jgi:hypothetical protein
MKFKKEKKDKKKKATKQIEKKKPKDVICRRVKEKLNKTMRKLNHEPGKRGLGNFSKHPITGAL